MFGSRGLRSTSLFLQRVPLIQVLVRSPPNVVQSRPTGVHEWLRVAATETAVSETDIFASTTFLSNIIDLVHMEMLIFGSLETTSCLRLPRLRLLSLFIQHATSTSTFLMSRLWSIARFGLCHWPFRDVVFLLVPGVDLGRTTDSVLRQSLVLKTNSPRLFHSGPHGKTELCVSRGD